MLLNFPMPGESKVPTAWPNELMRLIHEAQNTDDWQTVLDRIDKHPEEAHVVGEYAGQTALHAACFRYPPLEVVQRLLKEAKETASHQNKEDEVPLHHASYSSSEDVQIALIDSAPETVGMKDRYGDCPLHFAARSGATFTLLERMLQACPEALSQRNRRGATPFWLLPRTYLRAQSLSEILEEDEEFHDDWENMKLFLKSSYPFSSNEEFLVHAAAATPACPRIVLKFICGLFPTQALQYDQNGMTPLLLAAKMPLLKQPREWDETEDGYREHFEVVEANEGDAHDSNNDADETSLQEDASGYVRRMQNNLPADNATSEASEEASGDEEDDGSVINIILEVNRSAASYADRDGRLPLAHALISGKPWKSAILPLIAACPRALESRDVPSQLYMYQLAALHSTSLDIVFTLVRSLPALISLGIEEESRSAAPDTADSAQARGCKRTKSG